MQVLENRKQGILRLLPVTAEEEVILREIPTVVGKSGILEYHGRGGANPNDPPEQRMWLNLSYGGKEFKLVGTSNEDDHEVRKLRDALYYGDSRLILIDQSDTEGKLALDFTSSKCKICGRQIISRIECEWHVCDVCAKQCKHQYKRGPVHGGGIDIGVGEFCSVCGRGKPMPEGEAKKPAYDHHIAAEEELGMMVVYENLPGVTPRMMKGLMEGTLKKVLIVEDDKTWSDIIRQSLDDKVLIAQAFSTEEAEAILARHPDIALILMDACVPGDKPNTMQLVRKIRETFKGPIVAISSDSRYRKELIKAGCDYESEKPVAAQKVLELLTVS